MIKELKKKQKMDILMGIFQDFLDSLIILLNDPEIYDIALLSIIVSSSSVVLASIIGIPLGLYFGMRKRESTPGKIFVTLLNTSMGLPPVLVGLIVYLLLTRQGPLGDLSLLFTPLAMIFAQTILTLPIVIGITRSTVRELPDELPEMLESLGGTKSQIRYQIFLETRSGIIIAIIVALGRAFSEVGAILIVGGNVRFSTRVLTTAIITEIGMGQRPTALALGLILLVISFVLNSMLTVFQFRSR